MAKPTLHPAVHPEQRPAPRDDLVPTAPREPGRPDLSAVAVAVVVLVAAVVFLPDAVTGDVDLDADGGVAAVEGGFAWAVDAPTRSSAPLVAGDTVLVGQGDVPVPTGPDGAPTGPTADAALPPAGLPPASAGGPATVRAHRVANGAQRWSASFAGPVAVPLAAGDGAALVRTATSIAVLDLDTGEVRWDRPYDPDLAPPGIGGGVLVVPGADVVALDVDDGEMRWRRQFPATQPPVVVGDVAYMVAPQVVRALDVDDGEEHWAVALDSPAGFATPPVVAGDLVVVGNRIGTLEAFERADGGRRWSVETAPDDPVVSLFVSGEMVVAGGESGTVYTHRLGDGAPLWEFETDVDLAVPGSVQAAGHLVAVGGPPSGELAVLDRQDGDLHWALAATGAVTTPLLVGPDVVVGMSPEVGPRLDDLVSLSLDDGRERWRTGLGAEAAAMPVPSSDGFVLLVTRTPGGDASRLRALR